MEEDITLAQEDSDTQMSQLSSWNKRGARKKSTPSTEAEHSKKRGKKRQAPPPTADDDDNDEEESSQVIPSSLKGDKLIPEQEEAAMEWYRDNPDLYAKKSPKFMDTGHKTRLFDAQAKKMGICCKYNIVFLFIFLFFFCDLLSNLEFCLFNLFFYFFIFLFIFFFLCKALLKLAKVKQQENLKCFFLLVIVF